MVLTMNLIKEAHYFVRGWSIAPWVLKSNFIVRSVRFNIQWELCHSLLLSWNFEAQIHFQMLSHYKEIEHWAWIEAKNWDVILHWDPIYIYIYAAMNNYITKTVGKIEKDTFNFLSNITNGFCPQEKQNVT